MSAAELEVVENLPVTDITGIRVGTLIGFTDNGATPLVTYPQQPGTAAMPARTTVDVQGAHIGREVVLVFENANPVRPLILGVVRNGAEQALHEQPGTVEIDADGERLLVTAKEQLVLKCGSASITLTKAGKVLISGAFVSNRSTGVLRIAGSSVQLN